ncbi:MAG: M1 family metallopeptidase [Myxococcales bacterium]|nr:M1 family metallopeptidase [Myxococcales bacterium]
MALVLALGGCQAQAPAPTERVPEPADALRPEAQRGPIPEAAHVVDHGIVARYDEALHQIDGRTRITWRNHGPGPVSALPFHLYMNGFRAADTAWMRQGRGHHRGQRQDRQHPWGYVDVARVERLGGPGDDGEPSRTALRFTEHDEPSLMTVWLDAPVPPGESVQLEVRFTTQLPRVFARTGFADRFVMAGQWFPKPGVQQPDGRWRAHPFSFHGEFYADFGDYEVELDLPGDLMVGATGIQVATEHEGSRQRVRYRARMVHDFAWAAGPDLVEAFDDYEGIRIRALLPADRAGDAAEHLDAQRAALQSMEARFGPYPWSTITLVDPPPGAEGAEGMEYPTFYTTQPTSPMPGPLRALGFDHRLGGRFTTIHEFGHQYFQGLLASDEFTQPWLDEGLDTFANLMVYLDTYGDETGAGPWIVEIAGHPLGLMDGIRLEQWSAGPIQPIDQPADHFTPLVGAYASVSYRQTAATLLTLRRLVGEAAFDAALRRYADRARFGHPTGADLEATFVEALGERVVLGHTETGTPIELSLPRFFDQALRSTATVGFRVHRVGEQPKVSDAGWHRDEHGTLVGGDEPLPEPPEGGWPDDALEGVVVVHRTGEFVLPVEIEVELGDGSRVRRLWDGTGRYRVLHFPGQRVRWAAVDPDGRLVLESRRYDNTRYARGQSPPLTVEGALGRMSEISTLALGGALGP